MKSQNIEKVIKDFCAAEKTDVETTAEMDTQIINDASAAHQKSKNEQSAALEPNIWRIIMKHRITKFATAAAVILIVLLGITLLDKSVPSAYAFEQTVEAFESVRYMHLISSDSDEQIIDERWIEIGPSGFQVRYRQDTPPDFFVVEDGETVAVHHKDKNTVVLWDPKDKQYQWIADLRGWLEELTGEASMVIEENVDYGGQQAHHISWLELDEDVYIDPETKLPIAMAGYEISYEQPPEGIFDIVIPDGVEVVDKRPGAEPTEDPEWLVDEKLADTQFKSARYALAGGDYEKAARLFESVVAIQPMRNWAWFWMGRAYYELGQYEEAIEAYSKVIDMMSGMAYCHFARGLAYVMNGMDSAAREDITQALPSMMRTLRYINAANMFDYADNPRHRGYEPNEQQRLAKMINRLRMATGQNFGFDPDASPQEIEEVISAWEDWYKTSGDINVDPGAELIIIPGPLWANQDPYLTSKITEQEAVAIEEFSDFKKAILTGQVYADRSTPVRALLSMLSGLHARDRAVVDESFAIGALEMVGEITEDKMAAFETYLTTYEILRAPAPPDKPSHGQIWPVYVRNAGSDDLSDTFLFVFINGHWRFGVNAGDPNVYWEQAVPKIQEMLEKAGK